MSSAIYEEPQVSVIMPAYNAQTYIGEAILSVQRQSFTNWELILIEDCSSDKTLSIICEAMTEDSRIHLIQNKKNIGVAESRNIGIAHARGEWIAFLDSDDCWHPEKLSRQLEFAVNQNYPFTFTGSGFMDENSELLSYYLPVPKQITFRQLLKQNLISCSSVLVRKNILPYFPTVSERMHEDFALWLIILRNSVRVAFGLNEPLLFYRLRAGSKSGNKLNAAAMTFQVYRYIGLSIPKFLYYWAGYARRSLIKYYRLKNKGKPLIISNPAPYRPGDK